MIFRSEFFFDKTKTEPDVLLLVLFSDLDVGTIGFEVMRGDLPQDLHVHGEEHLQTAFLDVVVPEERRDSDVAKIQPNLNTSVY